MMNQRMFFCEKFIPRWSGIELHQLGAVDKLEAAKQNIVDLKDFLSSFVGSLCSLLDLYFYFREEMQKF